MSFPSPGVGAVSAAGLESWSRDVLLRPGGCGLAEWCASDGNRVREFQRCVKSSELADVRGWNDQEGFWLLVISWFARSCALVGLFRSRGWHDRGLGPRCGVMGVSSELWCSCCQLIGVVFWLLIAAYWFLHVVRDMLGIRV